MIILNFSHPLTEEQLARVAELTGQPHERLIEVKVQFDLEADFIPQVNALFEGIDLTPLDWQSRSFLVVLPALNHIAALVLIALNAKMWRFPTIIRLRPVKGALITTYEVAETLDLQEFRRKSRVPLFGYAEDVEYDDELDKYDDDEDKDYSPPLK